jgi:hypothetical protein
MDLFYIDACENLITNIGTSIPTDEQIKMLSKYPSLTWSIIRNNHTLNWDWDFLSEKSSKDEDGYGITDFVNNFVVGDNVKFLYTKSWNFIKLSRNPSLEWSVIISDLNSDNPKPWNVYQLCERSDFAWDLMISLQTTKNINLNWDCLSQHPSLTITHLTTYPNKPWNWFYISRHDNITWNHINSNPNLNWDWSSISLNKNITWEIVKSNPFKPWNYSALENNEQINTDFKSDAQVLARLNPSE